MIQPPEPVGRRHRGLALAGVALVLATAVPAIALVGRISSERPASSPPAVPTGPAVRPLPSGAAHATSDASQVAIPIRPGPMAVAIGFNHGWVASAGDASLRRIDADGTVDRAPIVLATGRAPSTPGVDAQPVVGLGAGFVWVAGVPGPRDLVAVDATSATVVGRAVLPSPATGIAGGFDAAWVATRDGRLLRVARDGAVAGFVGPASAPLSVAVGDRYVWASHASTILALDPADGGVVARFVAGGGPIAVADGTVWALGSSTGGRDLTAIDEAALRVTYRSDVGTSGFSGIAWALPSIIPTRYADVASLVAPRTVDSALVGDVAWVARPVEGELVRIGPANLPSAGATLP